MTTIRNPQAEPTTAQISFLMRLVRERQASNMTAEADIELTEAWIANGANRAQVSALIERLKGLPRRKPSGVTGDLSEGLYVAGDEIVRVYKARNGSHMLAKRLTGDAYTGYSYEYAGQAARVLAGMPGVRKMSLTEAQGWGRATGTCCVCARELTDGESIDRGIGPVCGSRI